LSTRVALHHVTTYRYDRDVALSPQVIRLRPAPYCRAAIENYSLRISPADHSLHWQLDPLHNYLARATFGSLARELQIEVDLTAHLEPYNPFDFFLEPETSTFPFRYEPSLAAQLVPYFELEQESPQFSRFFSSLAREAGTIDLIIALSRRVGGEIEYVRRAEPGVQTVAETLSAGRGSCRDSAWLLVQTLRRLGIAARFVSGYLVQLANGAAGDVAELHAWCESNLPGAGWVGIDST
jgi:transglutaminase-like putative cysteine protease